MDISRKAEILREHSAEIALVSEDKKLTFQKYFKGEAIDEDYYEAVNTTVSCFCSENYELYKDIIRIKKADFERIRYLKSRIQNMLSQGTCYFLTLTFRDDVLNSTNSETRRKHVTRFLKETATQYVANIDFGSQNGREHYHAVVLADSVQNALWSSSDGFIKSQKVKKTSDAVKLGKYISKLTNHAIKETTKRSRIIYSR